WGSRMPEKDSRTSVVRQGLWWICLFVAPAVLVSIELFHPSGFTRDPGMFAFLSQPQPERQFHALDYFGPHWWLTLHMIQTPLVGLVAVGLWLMVEPVGAADPPAARACAWAGRAAIFVMAVYFTVLDGIGGIGLGRSILVVQQMATDGKL